MGGRGDGSADSIFGDDPGTAWLPARAFPLSGLPARSAARELRRRAGRLPVVWFVDDERANREWFARHHRPHFAVVTFSRPGQAMRSLRRGIPADAIVTDIFFPARAPATGAEARALSRIYRRIERSRVEALPALWKEVSRQWALDGFRLARDVARWPAGRRGRPPVLLFSRKTSYLLGADDWLRDEAAVRGTFWMLEKVKPAEPARRARRAAAIQRIRVEAAIRASGR